MTRFLGYMALACCAALPVAAEAQANIQPVTDTRLPNPSVAAATTDTLSYYDANALRVESRGQGLRIFRGINGPVIAETGAFHTFDLTRIVAPSENAIREAHEFNRNYGPGMVTTAVGGLILGVALAFDLNSDSNWAIAAGEVGGGGLAIYGARRLNVSYSALSKAIWWYNRDLKK